MAIPLWGEVWLVDLDPIRGHEQAGRRPGLVVSVGLFNGGPSGLVVVRLMTSRGRGFLWHVEVLPPDGGVRVRSFILRSFIQCEAIRSSAKERLVQHWGSDSAPVFAAVERRLRILLVL
jgi:mRNA interferase MazF